MIAGNCWEGFLRYPLRRAMGESSPGTIRSPCPTRFVATVAEKGDISGVARPSFKLSWTPDMNCRMLPVVKRLDHDPRDEFEEEREGPDGGGAVGEDGRRGHAGETGLALRFMGLILK